MWYFYAFKLVQTPAGRDYVKHKVLFYLNG